MKKVVLMFSGGLDSTTCLSKLLNEDYKIYPISFKYGQRHKIENIKAQKIIEYYQKKYNKLHDIFWFDLDLRQLGGSALTDNIDIPTSGITNIIPVTYVPGRNIVFMSIACAYAEVNNIKNVCGGMNNIDYSGYPDCRPEFINNFQKMVLDGMKSNITILTPLINLSKVEIIKLGKSLNIPYEMTYSCYQGKEEPCGVCDSCRIRLKAFKEITRA